MTEEECSNHLSDEVLRCSTMYSDRLLKSLFFEGLHPAKYAQIRNYRNTSPQKDYKAVSRYSQAICETHRCSCRLDLLL